MLSPSFQSQGSGSTRQDWESGLLTPQPRSFLTAVREERWHFIPMTVLQRKITNSAVRERLRGVSKGCCLSESSQARGAWMGGSFCYKEEEKTPS